MEEKDLSLGTIHEEIGNVRKVRVEDVEYGIKFSLTDIEVLSIEDLETRLSNAFPEYKFLIVKD